MTQLRGLGQERSTTVSDLEVYLSRLRYRLHSANVPEAYYRQQGHPFIDTPHGRILRPSLSHRAAA